MRVLVVVLPPDSAERVEVLLMEFLPDNPVVTAEGLFAELLL